MRIITPITITNNAIVETNAPTDTGIFEWSSATNYLTGAVAWYGAPYNLRWEALADNLNKPPWSNPELWLELGPTNQFAMFDPRIGNATTSSATYSADYAVETTATRTGIAVKTAPKGDFDALALFDVVGEFVDIRVEDPDSVEVFAQRLTIAEGVTDLAIWNIPLQTYDRDNDIASTVWISIWRDAADGRAACGVVAVGKRTNVGKTTHGTRLGILDYSQKSTDDFGNVSVVERRFAKRMQPTVMVQTGEIDAVHRLLATIRATPVVWQGSDTIAASLVYGYWREFDIDVQSDTWSALSLDIEGLI